MSHPTDLTAESAADLAAVNVALPLDAGAGVDAEPMTPFELRMHLEAFGLTQAELAQLLGANARTVPRWLEGNGGEGPRIPGTVASTVRAWQRLQHAGLPWRPDDAVLYAGDRGAPLPRARSGRHA